MILFFTKKPTNGLFAFPVCINPIPPGLFEGGAACVGGGGVPAVYNSETINDNEMKLGGVVKDH